MGRSGCTDSYAESKLIQIEDVRRWDGRFIDWIELAELALEALLMLDDAKDFTWSHSAAQK